MFVEIFLLGILILVLLILYMLSGPKIKEKNNVAGIINKNQVMQEVFVTFFEQYGWNLEDLEFHGMTAITAMTDEQWKIANEYSKNLGLVGEDKYKMLNFAYTDMSEDLKNGYSYDIQFTLQLSDEKSEQINFAVLMVKLMNSSNDIEKEWLYPVNTDQVTIEDAINEYLLSE